MRLKNLLENIYDGEIQKPFDDLDIQSVSSDSRTTRKNSLFIALQGASYRGSDFVKDAVNRGACCVVMSSDAELPSVNGHVCYLAVPDTQKFLKSVAQKFFDNPSHRISTIGVTGTNGKTTLSYLLEAILQSTGKICGVIGTVNYRVGQHVWPSPNTTPAILDNQQLLSEMINQGADYCVMEVSSHALDQGRVDLVDFKAAIFTNLTSDHLDYHKTRENYFLAKAKLFVNLSAEATAIINADDLYGQKLISKTQAKVITYGISNRADVMAEDIQVGTSGTEFKLKSLEGEAVIRTKLVGIYNVYNVLAAIACALSQKINLDKIKSAIEQFSLVPGRLEAVDYQQDYSIFIDYAHTQDALENVLKTLRQVSDSKVILVFGCGGNRDKTKRPEMGKVAGSLADYSIVTSDNPRNEDPQSIINQIVAGFENDNYEVIVDRQEAIKKALSLARKGDIVLIAGKGHETYQIFKDRTIKFDERQVIREILRC